MRFELFFIVFALAVTVTLGDDNLDESQTIEQIELLGGTVKRDEKLPGRPVVYGALVGRKVNDNHMRLFRPLVHLTELKLHFTDVTDAGVKELGHLERLKKLKLENSKISDESLETISEFEELTELDLKGTKVTPKGLAKLKKLHNLTHLGLSFVNVGNEGLKEVCEIKSLKELDIPASGVTDAGLKHLGGLEQLTKLYLDAGISAKRLNEFKQEHPQVKVSIISMH